MERKFYGRYGAYAPLLCIITLVATTLRTVAVFLGVSPYGFFEHAILADVSAWIIVAGILLALTYPFTHRKAHPIYRDDRTALTYLPAAVLGLGILLFGAAIVPYALQLLSFPFYAPLREALIAFRLPITAALLVVLCACGVLYTAAVCLIDHTLSDKRSALGMLTVLLYGVYAAFLYYDTTLPLNAPTKITDQMTYLAFALFFLYEVRISLGCERRTLYSAFGFVAGMLAAYSAVPSFLLYIFNGRVLSYSLGETLLTLATLAFIIGRMLVCDSSPEDRPNALMGEIIRVAEIRDQARAALAEAALPKVETLEHIDTPEAQSEIAPIPSTETDVPSPNDMEGVEEEPAQIAIELPDPITNAPIDNSSDTIAESTEETSL